MIMVSVHKPLRSPISYGNNRGGTLLYVLLTCIAFVQANRKASSKWRRFRY
jgi:hypothetical protein